MTDSELILYVSVLDDVKPDIGLAFVGTDGKVLVFWADQGLCAAFYAEPEAFDNVIQSSTALNRIAP